MVVENYITLASEMMAQFSAADLDNLFTGRLENYCYQAGRDLQQGTYDIHYENRLRLCYALLFDHRYLANPQREQLIRTLFQEELKDRKTNSFQGIGTCLELLTGLLAAYHRAEDEQLFVQAKEANFDCACGYAVKAADHIPVKMEEFSLDHWIEIAVELKQCAYAMKLIAIWEAAQATMDIAQYRSLRYWKRDCEDLIGETKALEKILQLTLETEDHWAIASAYQDYVQQLLIVGELEEAGCMFQKLQSHLPLAHKDWCTIGLGRFALESCMDLILLQPEQGAPLWQWARPFLLKGLPHLHGNLCQKAARVAEQQKEPELAEKFFAQYARWKFPAKD